MRFEITKKQTNSCNCFVCGRDNKGGLFASFYETKDKEVVSVMKSSLFHQSYPEHTHGGIICAILDETAGRAMWIDEPGVLAVTSRISVKYRRPVPLEEDFLAVGKVVGNTPIGFVAVGKIYDKKGNLLAESEGTYIKQKPSAISKQEGMEDEIMFMIPDDETVSVLEW